MKRFFRNTDAIVILSPANLHYYSGFDNPDARIILTPAKNYYLTDARNLEAARLHVKGFELIQIERGEYTESAARLCKDLGVHFIGYEENAILYKDFQLLLGADKDLIPMHERFVEQRAEKTEAEIEKIKEAQAVTDAVYTEILAAMKPGVTEKEIASKLCILMYERGCTPAFAPIVAFGKHTAMPHYAPSDTVLQKKDVVLLDFGARYQGYCADMSRSFAVGEATPRYKEMYKTVLEAQTVAMLGLKTDMLCQNGDALARGYFKDRGLAESFTHALGHSIGIEVHESPNLSPRDFTPIPPSAVLTVEPGLYFAGEFGVRIEDMMYFSNIGAYSLTKSPKELIIL